MRDPRRAPIDLLRHARPDGAGRGARSGRRGGGDGVRGEPRKVRGQEDQGVPRPQGHRAQQAPHRPHHEGQGLVSAYASAKFKPSRSSADEADVPNIVNREFDGRSPRTHVVGDLAYVRVGARWCYVCLLIDLYNREIVGHAVGERKDAGLVKSAFAALSFPLDDIEVFHAHRGPEFNSAAIDELLDVFEIKRSLSAKGCSYDNSVDESTKKILKAEFVYRERFSTLRELQAKLSDYVNWYNSFRLHSTLGYMSPVELRLAGLTL